MRPHTFRAVTGCYSGQVIPSSHMHIHILINPPELSLINGPTHSHGYFIFSTHSGYSPFTIIKRLLSVFLFHMVDPQPCLFISREFPCKGLYILNNREICSLPGKRMTSFFFSQPWFGRSRRFFSTHHLGRRMLLFLLLRAVAM